MATQFTLVSSSSTNPSSLYFPCLSWPVSSSTAKLFDSSSCQVEARVRALSARSSARVRRYARHGWHARRGYCTRAHAHTHARTITTVRAGSSRLISVMSPEIVPSPILISCRSPAPVMPFCCVASASSVSPSPLPARARGAARGARRAGRRLLLAVAAGARASVAARSDIARQREKNEWSVSLSISEIWASPFCLCCFGLWLKDAPTPDLSPLRLTH